MSSLKRKDCAEHSNSQWPQPVTFEYHDDLSDKKIAEVREAAKAPAENDPDWKVVDGPGW